MNKKKHDMNEEDYFYKCFKCSKPLKKYEENYIYIEFIGSIYREEMLVLCDKCTENLFYTVRDWLHKKE
jgi:predicted SprT family Zn-dependent metalloprotease